MTLRLLLYPALAIVGLPGNTVLPATADPHSPRVYRGPDAAPQNMRRSQHA